MSVESRMKSLLEEASVLERVKAALAPLGSVSGDSRSVMLRPHDARRMDDFYDSYGFSDDDGGDRDDAVGERWDMEYAGPMRRKVAEALKKAKLSSKEIGRIEVSDKGSVHIDLR